MESKSSASFEFNTLAELVAVRSQLGDKILAHFGEDSLTYADAHTRSNIVANSLLGLGVRKGDVVASLMYNSVEHVLLWFGCAKIGAIWAPLNISLRRDDLNYALRDASPRLLVVEEELYESYGAIRSSSLVEQELLLGSEDRATELGMLHASLLQVGGAEEADIPIFASDPVAIVYTGGSTGNPKGVLCPNRYFIATGMRYQEVAQPGPADVMYECGHLFHSGGQQNGIIGPMYSGITSVMTRWFSVGRLWPLVNRRGVTLMSLPGPMLKPILDRTPTDGGPNHPVRMGLGIATGQVRREIRDQFEERFGFPLLEVYAQTEMGVLLCSERIGEQRRGSSGHSYGWAEVQVVDDNDGPLPPRVEGEIVTRATVPYTFMLEYYKKPEVTIHTSRNYWHHTGDLGYLDEDGFVYFTGRRAYWIRRRGENISSFEVEKPLSEHPDVIECAVVGVPSELGDEDVKAYVVASENSSLSEPGVVEWLASKIAYFKVPRYVEFVSGLPRTVTKEEIERQKLKGLGINDAWDREATPE